LVSVSAPSKPKFWIRHYGLRFSSRKAFPRRVNPNFHTPGREYHVCFIDSTTIWPRNQQGNFGHFRILWSMPLTPWLRQTVAGMHVQLVVNNGLMATRGVRTGNLLICSRIQIRGNRRTVSDRQFQKRTDCGFATFRFLSKR